MNDTTPKKKDPRRRGQIMVETVNAELYRIRIDGELWASVEWSPTKGVWCVEDGIGKCLAHVGHIHGEEPDADEAIRLARAMIRDGRMPTPEEAFARLDAERAAEHAARVAERAANTATPAADPVMPAKPQPKPAMEIPDAADALAKIDAALERAAAARKEPVPETKARAKVKQ
jgi:hypothetical protein